MAWIDNIIGFFNPKAACDREAWRQQLSEMKSYDGANYGRLNANWRMTNQSAEMTDRFSRDTLRARARDLERNSDIMNGLISAYKRNVVGKGYTLQARTSKPKLNAQLEKLWNEWTKPRNCDVTGQQSFNQMLRMMVERKLIDGGILIHKCYTNGGVLPFKLQLLEVDELCSAWSAPHADGNRVVNGVEYNSFNKPVGYWIQHYDIDGIQQVTADYYDAKDIIFYYSKKRPSQIREISDVAPAITRIRDANEFMTAVSVKERIAACLSVFIKKVNPGGFGRGSGESSTRSYNGKMLTPGMITEMNAGDEIQVVDPSAGGSEATDYLKLQQRLIGAGQGLSYESTSRDMSQVNYSSARQGAIEDELTYAEEMELLQNIMTEIYESFVISAMLAGKIKLPSFFESEEKKLDYLEHEWVASPKRWIDPQKEASAQMIAMKYGIKTFKQVAAEQGRDWQEQLDDIAEIQEYAISKGIDLNLLLFGQQTATNQEATETDEAGSGIAAEADIISEGVPEGVSDEQAEKMADDIKDEIPRINGEQAKAVVTIILQYVNQRISIGQAVNIVSLITGIDRESAREIIEDKAEETPDTSDGGDAGNDNGKDGGEE